MDGKTVTYKEQRERVHVRKRRTSQGIFCNTRLALKQADIEMGRDVLRFREIDDVDTVRVYSQPSRRQLSSAFLIRISMKSRASGKYGTGCIPSLRSIDFTRTCCVNGICIMT